MQCVKCGAEDTRVVWTKQLYSHTARGHKCGSCEIAFETHEVAVTAVQPPALPQYSPSLDEKLEAIINADEEE